MWKSCLAVEESPEESGLLIKDDFHYPDVSPLRLDFHSYFCCLLNIHDVYTSICPTVGGTLVVPLYGRVTENSISDPFYYFPNVEHSLLSREINCFGAGGGDESPHCHLLEVDGFNFLLDCGWDETFDMVFINNLKKVSNSHLQRRLSIWNCKVSILQFHKKILIFSREPKATQWTTWPGPSCLDHTKTLAHFAFPSYPLES